METPKVACTTWTALAIVKCFLLDKSTKFETVHYAVFRDLRMQIREKAAHMEIDEEALSAVISERGGAAAVLRSAFQTFPAQSRTACHLRHF